MDHHHGDQASCNYSRYQSWLVAYQEEPYFVKMLWARIRQTLTTSKFPDIRKSLLVSSYCMASYESCHLPAFAKYCCYPIHLKHCCYTTSSETLLLNINTASQCISTSLLDAWGFQTDRWQTQWLHKSKALMSRRECNATWSNRHSWW